MDNLSKFLILAEIKCKKHYSWLKNVQMISLINAHRWKQYTIGE